MVNYIICSTARSGSNLLCEGLCNTRVAGYPNESLRTLVLKAKSDWDTHHLVNTVRGVYSTKTMWQTWDEFMNGLQALGIPLKDILIDAKFIWTRRRDKLAQAISFMKANQTNSWLSLEPCKQDPVYKPEQIAFRLRQIFFCEEKWEEWFSLMGVSPKIVWYEEMVSAYEQTALDVLDYLSIKRPESINWVRRLEKQGNAQSEEWKRQFIKDMGCKIIGM